MRILFLCVANSARSQIAEGLAKKELGEGHDIRSAGSEPSGTVNPLAIEVMNEVDVDLSKHYSKAIDSLDDEFLEKLDYVITLCAEEVCPILPSKATKLHWPNPDPAVATGSKEEQLAAFRNARDNISREISKFKNQS